MRIKTEAWVGIFFCVGLVIFGYITFKVQDMSLPWGSPERTFRAVFDRVDGLEIGSTITLAGMNVGRVAGMTLDGTAVSVAMRIRTPELIRLGSSAEMRVNSLLGGRLININPGPKRAPLLEDGALIPTARRTTDLDALFSTAAEVASHLKDTLIGFEASRQVLTDELSNTLVTFNEVGNELSGILKPTGKIIMSIAEGSGTIGKLIFDDEMANSIRRTLSNAETVSTNINSGQGTLGRLINERALYDQATTIASNFSEVSEKLNSNQGTLGQLIHDPSLANDARVVVSEFRGVGPNMERGFAAIGNVAAKIDQGQGTIGRLVNDDSLYRQAKSTIKDFGDAAENLQDQSVITSFIGMAFAVFR